MLEVEKLKNITFLTTLLYRNRHFVAWYAIVLPIFFVLLLGGIGAAVFMSSKSKSFITPEEQAEGKNKLTIDDINENKNKNANITAKRKERKTSIVVKPQNKKQTPTINKGAKNIQEKNNSSIGQSNGPALPAPPPASSTLFPSSNDDDEEEEEKEKKKKKADEEEQEATKEEPFSSSNDDDEEEEKKKKKKKADEEGPGVAEEPEVTKEEPVEAYVLSGRPGEESPAEHITDEEWGSIIGAMKEKKINIDENFKNDLLKVTFYGKVDEPIVFPISMIAYNVDEMQIKGKQVNPEGLQDNGVGVVYLDNETYKTIKEDDTLNKLLQQNLTSGKYYLFGRYDKSTKKFTVYTQFKTHPFKDVVDYDHDGTRYYIYFHGKISNGSNGEPVLHIYKNWPKKKVAKVVNTSKPETGLDAPAKTTEIK